MSNEEEKIAPDAEDKVAEESAAVEPTLVPIDEFDENQVLTGQWYMLHVYSGYEKRVKLSIIGTLEEYPELQQFFHKILIPTHEVSEIRGGKRVRVEKKFLPGYVLLNIDLDDNLVSVIRSISAVSGFLGTGGVPSPLEDEEVMGVLGKQRRMKEKHEIICDYEKGESVKIMEGPFINFTGVIEDIYTDRGKLRLNVPIFGRDTPVELEFGQVEKLLK